jgi:sporulation protein YlmC with PRC-barrel domain
MTRGHLAYEDASRWDERQIHLLPDLVTADSHYNPHYLKSRLMNIMKGSHMGETHDQSPLALSGTTLAGTRVVNSRGEELGHIEEVMIDVKTGRVVYLAISFGGFLGFGEKLFAVPWTSSRIDVENECAVVDITREQLKEAPGFDKHAWPRTPNEAWYHEVYEYYDEQPYWVTAS